MLIVRDLSNLFQQMSGFPINSKGGQNMMRKAGVNADSGQYKRVISDMKMPVMVVSLIRMYRRLKIV